MRLLKEPLLHFVLLGGLTFAAHAALGTARPEDQSHLAHLVHAARLSGG